MAIAFVSSADGGNTSTGTTLTWTHNVSGLNLIGFVGVQSDFTTDNITGVTWNGSAMTLVDKAQRGGNSRWTYLFYIIAPTSGSVVVTSGTSNKYIEGGSVLYSGASQTGQPDASNKASGDSASPTVAVTSIADNCWGLQWIITGGGTLVTGSQPLRLSINGGARNSDFYDTNAVITPAGSTTFNATISGTPSTYATIACTFAPAVAAASNSAMFALF